MTTPILKVIRAKEILADPFAGESALSEREKQVARLAARGNTAQEIAAELDIVPSTVFSYLKMIKRATGLSPRQLRQRMIERLEEALK